MEEEKKLDVSGRLITALNVGDVKPFDTLMRVWSV